MDRSELDHVEPNQGLHCQIAMCKQKTEQSRTKADTIFFLGCVHHIYV